MKKIPIVDDEKPISGIIKFDLAREDYGAVTTFDGREAITRFEEEDPDLVISDLMLPGLDGLEMAKEVRKTSHIPIIMLPTRDSGPDKVIGLEIGADDYVTKPLSSHGPLARVKTHLRRAENIETTVAEESASASSSGTTIGDLKILPDALVAQRRGEDIELTHRELKLLYHLATHMGQVMTREYLLETIWGYDYFGDMRTVDVTIRRLREKIEDTPSHPECILTRCDAGYYMKSHEWYNVIELNLF